jgi:hypothetical protein
VSCSELIKVKAADCFLQLLFIFLVKPFIQIGTLINLLLLRLLSDSLKSKIVKLCNHSVVQLLATSEHLQDLPDFLLKVKDKIHELAPQLLLFDFQSNLTHHIHLIVELLKFSQSFLAVIRLCLNFLDQIENFLITVGKVCSDSNAFFRGFNKRDIQVARNRHLFV